MHDFWTDSSIEQVTIHLGEHVSKYARVCPPVLALSVQGYHTMYCRPVAGMSPHPYLLDAQDAERWYSLIRMAPQQRETLLALAEAVTEGRFRDAMRMAREIKWKEQG